MSEVYMLLINLYVSGVPLTRIGLVNLKLCTLCGFIHGPSIEIEHGPPPQIKCRR